MFAQTAGTVDPNREIGTSRSFPLSVTVVASSNAADATNTRRRREHIQMDPDLFRQLKAAGLINLNNHLMLTMGGYSVPLTVQILAPQSTITQACIGVEALARFPGVSLPASGTLSAYAPSTPVDDAAAQAAGQYYEFLTDNGSNTTMLVIVPHAGNIELNTETLATAAKVALDAAGKATSIWGGRGYGTGAQDSYDHWHISTVDTWISQHPVLDTIDARGWTYCLSFHGQSASNRIDIGCKTAQDAFVDALVSALQGDAALSTQTIARTSDTSEIAGADSHNLGNRLSSHYVQFEIGPEARASSSMRDAIIANIATAWGAL